MAVSTLQSNAKGFVPVGTISGGPGNVPMLRGQEAASETFTTGAVLIRSSGLLAEASADAVADIVGIAAEPASGTTNAWVSYYPVGADIIFEGTLEDQTNEDHALVITNMYTDYALQVDSSGNWYVDENDTTNVACCVIAPREEEDIDNATVRARVKVVFHRDVTIYNT